MERTDALTGLLNRKAILELLEREAERVRRGGPGFALAMAELDGFGDVHASHGEEVAKQALVDVARLLQRTVRAQDLIARWGGEKLLAFLPGTSLDGGVRAAEKVRRAVGAKPRAVGGRELALTMSLGVAAVDPGQELPTCVQRADAALFHARAAGGNQVAYSGGATSLAEVHSSLPAEPAPRKRKAAAAAASRARPAAEGARAGRRSGKRSPSPTSSGAPRGRGRRRP